MPDTQTREAQETLVAILSTAASAGMDLELLCLLAAEELDSHEDSGIVNPYSAGAINQLGLCMRYVLEPHSTLGGEPNR
ncbi:MULTISPECIES: hypothetical protein [Gammaproteobacteria]|uniref:Uncharacterized protein n=1 Tax=Pseudomonas syringae pv. maculicola TaxID=59511 RepID=A0A3M2TKX3_PSEYM|nr:hypothetical protein [Pseudomonas syringae group genomosp. 3]KKI25498.1 hypothetical protein WX98_14200 [Pseudomonas syringae pv. persicae]RML15329.1 hypothetical protein APX70_04496 [Pseudomonas syringae pv. maculicola]